MHATSCSPLHCGVHVSVQCNVPHKRTTSNVTSIITFCTVTVGWDILFEQTADA